MQKKHLRLFLLFLVMTGCGRLKFDAGNDYLAGKQEFHLDDGGTGSMLLCYEGIEARVQGRSAPVFRFKANGTENEAWIFQWLDESGEPLSLPRRTTTRSLITLGTEDSVAGFSEYLVPLPGGDGVALYLEGEASRAFGFSLTAPAARLADHIRVGSVAPDQTQVIESDRWAVAIAAKERLEAIPARADSIRGQWAWRLHSDEKSRPVTVCFAGRADSATAIARRFVRRARHDVETEGLQNLHRTLGFSMRTGDDAANRMFALMTVALSSAGAQLRFDDPVRLEESAQFARALWLLRRDRTLWEWLKTDTATSPAQKELRQAERVHSILKAAADYGVAPEAEFAAAAQSYTDSLYARDVFIERSAPQDTRPWKADSVMSFAVWSVQRAAAYQLAEEIVRVHSDPDKQGTLRSGYLEAARDAKRSFKTVARRYAAQAELPRQYAHRFNDIFDSTAAEIPMDQVPDFNRESYPDTLAYLRAGARGGFNWLTDTPMELWNPRRVHDPFTWQRWVAYRFNTDLKTVSTPDYDSLVTLMLSGRLPGFIPETSTEEGEPSLISMAAAMENLAELYLGVKPNWMHRRLTIEPRLPVNWGRTLARIPFGSGFISVDYDFAQQRALLAVSELSGELSVFFGYPLDSGGFVRTQFKLDRRNPAARVIMEREPDNRVRLFVDDTP